MTSDATDDNALNEAWLARFSGFARLYGSAAIRWLQQSHFMVVGIGGVGSWSAEYFARSGVGEITLIDNDTISASNINRQIHALESSLQQVKVAGMAERILEINPACRINIRQQRLTVENIPQLIPLDNSLKLTGVVDAIDSVSDKAVLIYHCRRNKIPLITVGGAGGLIDPTSITITDLSRTFNDPLASRVRARLRRDYGFSRNTERRFGVECVFSAEQPRYPQADGTISHCKPSVDGLRLDCNYGYGASSGITAIFGMMAASRLLNQTYSRWSRTA
ncbi:MAG: ThiF family adenylyltransferase [Gammaproteobacteria bacterium]|nr:ThiF family adenylyltransferase [Gammaproteobacteria bacterium]